MRRCASYLSGLIAAIAVLAAPGVGHACGGLFRAEPIPGQPPETITVAAQRVALSLSAEQTVLWSQIEYEGDPSQFAWVLPVGRGATLEAANDAWFEALDAFTATQVSAPQVICYDDSGGSSSGGCGCGAAGDAGAAPGGDFRGPDTPGVQVIHQGSVAEYETVTIETGSGQAAQRWLVDNGYAVPPEVTPVLDAYAAEGLDFIALRLRPGADVKKMTPVRVITRGGGPIVPLRMMVAGAGASVPLSLFVISEGRYAPESFPEAALPAGELTWDFATESSNHADLRAEALAANEGRGLLTTFAEKQAFNRESGSPITVEGVDGPREVRSLVELYFEQAAANDERARLECHAGNILAQQGDLEVVAGCTDGESPSGPCGGGVTLEASRLTCGDYTDLAVALTGMRPNDVWITRLEANLPVAALTADLELKAAPAQDEVSSRLIAASVENVPCSDYAVEGGLALRSRPQSASAALAAAAVGAFLMRRRR
jgi:hypothetical protein